MKGKLIVFEGSDGSGKTTQLSLLKNYLRLQDIPVKTIDFPRYQESFFGKVVARFLRGEFGDLKSVNPYLISIVYSMDRKDAKVQMEQWLSEGTIVLSNRYATSNLAHQAGRLPKKKRDAFIDWDITLEYTVNGIPKEDLVVFLRVPFAISWNLIRNKDRSKRDYLAKKKDVAEKNETYLRNAESTYLYLAKKFPHWVTIECVDKHGKLLGKQAIHEKIMQALKEKGLL